MDKSASPWFSYLPQAILNHAYKASNGEPAWARPDAVAVVKTLQSRGFAIHGGGIWLPTHPGPTIPTPFVYDWSAAAYAIRALEFIETFKWGPTDRSHGGMAPWFNILADRDDDAALTRLFRFIHVFHTVASIMKIDNILAWHVLLPHDILRQAYRCDEELAWARPVAEHVIALLEANNYTITSVETWLPTTPGPTPLILDWDDTKEQSALDFVQTVDPEHRFGARLGLETYFNIDAEAATRS